MRISSDIKDVVEDTHVSTKSESVNKFQLKKMISQMLKGDTKNEKVEFIIDQTDLKRTINNLSITGNIFKIPNGRINKEYKPNLGTAPMTLVKTKTEEAIKNNIKPELKSIVDNMKKLIRKGD